MSEVGHFTVSTRNFVVISGMMVNECGRNVSVLAQIGDCLRSLDLILLVTNSLDFKPTIINFCCKLCGF